jgi:hypothetical protein
MLETLLESKARSERSVAGAIVSVTAHTALIAAALYATAQARVQPAESPEIVRPVFFPSPQNPASTASRIATRQRPLDGRPPIFAHPRLDLHIPAFDVTNLVTKPGDFSPSPILRHRGAGQSGIHRR